MKNILAVLTLVLITNLASAQAFENKRNYLNFGIGVDPFSNIATPFLGYKYYNVGPIVVGYERGITEILGIGRIGVGGVIGHSFQGEKNGTYKTSWTRTTVIMRCAYHFDLGVEKMDLYAGIGGGSHFYSKHKSNNVVHSTSAGSVITHYVFGGIRYYFTNSFGVYAEAGDGLATLHGGLVLKF